MLILFFPTLLSRVENQQRHTHKHTRTGGRIPNFSPPPNVGPGAGWVEDWLVASQSQQEGDQTGISDS